MAFEIIKLTYTHLPIVQTKTLLLASNGKGAWPLPPGSATGR